MSGNTRYRSREIRKILKVYWSVNEKGGTTPTAVRIPVIGLSEDYPMIEVEVDESDDEDPADDGRPICNHCGFPGCQGDCATVLGFNTP